MGWIYILHINRKLNDFQAGFQKNYGLQYVPIGWDEIIRIKCENGSCRNNCFFFVWISRRHLTELVKES